MKLLLLVLFCLTKTTAWAGEKSLYDFVWLDPDKKVYVLQNKLYKKEHSVYFDAGYIDNQTSKFQDTRGLALKTGWYFHEEWGIEAFYNKYSNTNNDDFNNVRLLSANQFPFVRRITDMYGLIAIWSPFYGKINTFNNIYYFDWSFGLGISKIKSESNLKTALDTLPSIKYEKENYTGAVLKTNVKFHITESFHLDLGYMNTYYKAPSPKSPKTNKLRTNTDVVLSAGFSI
jgi:outer membrane beta-barrel protein